MTTGTLGLGKSKIPVVQEAVLLEPVSQDVDLSQEARDERFMNELVEIMIHESSDANASSHVTLAVNGMNMVVFRGIPTPVKRKYLEVLARMKETKYNQVWDKREIERYEMKARTGLIYPFDVIRDDNAKGAPWLRAIIAERDE